MTRHIVLTSALALLSLAACGQGPSGREAPPKNVAGYDPSNSAVNERDRDRNAVTPGDQGEDRGDIRITADIRKAILADDAMSTDARNCKVITVNGVTTLRGVVDSDAEKSAIEAKARAVVGVTQVDNQLEVKQSR